MAIDAHLSLTLARLNAARNVVSPTFVPVIPTLTGVTGFVYDHGTNSYAAAALTGTLQQAIPGLLPQLGKDDGALLGAGTVTYPPTSAISGTGDFTIVALAVVSSTDTVFVYSANTSAQLRLDIGGAQDRLQVNVGGAVLAIDESNVGINDGRPHLYVLYRRSGVVTMLVDGRQIASADAAGSIAASVPTTVLTGTPTVDEVAWWRRALTDTELDMLLAAANLLTSSTGLLSGQWLQQHLAEFAFSDSDIDAGSSMIDTPNLSTGDAALTLAMIGAAEDGMIFVNGAGALVEIGRNSFGLSTCTIGDGGGSEIPITDIPGWSMDIDRVANRVQVTKDGYVSVTADDLASQNSYGIRSMQWSAGLLEASQMTDASLWLLARYSQPQLRLDTIQVRGFPGGFWPTLLALELGDRITVNHHPPGGTLLTAEVIVEHISHSIVPDDWVITLQLAPLPPVMIWDDPVRGWDGGWSWAWGEPWPRNMLWDDPIQGWDGGYLWT